MNKIEELENKLKEEKNKMQANLKENYKWVVGKYVKFDEYSIMRIDNLRYIPINTVEHDDEYFSVEDHNSAIVLPKGTIRRLTGRDLKWEDDPISLKSVIEGLPHVDI